MKRMVLAATLVGALATQSPAGIIDGTVIDDQGGPVPGAAVTLLSAGRAARTAQADERGVFILDGLPAGAYTVSASKPGYVARSFGQASPHAVPVTIALAANTRFRARIRLARFGAISGSITDDTGQPIAAAVRAERIVLRDGLRIPEDRLIRTEADRQGRYRFTDLPPGDYLVSAIGPDGEFRRTSASFVQEALQAIQQPGQPVPVAIATEPRVSYVPIYHSGVVGRGRATPVTVAPGEERTTVSVQLQLVQTARVEGTVTDAGGKLFPYVNVRLLGGEDGAVWSYGAASATAAFRMAPVPLGAYRLVAYSPSKSGMWAVADVVVAPNAAPLVVRVEPTGSLLGRAVFAGTTPPPDCRRTSCRPVVRPRAAGLGVAVTGVMDAAGPIVFQGLAPGAFMLSAAAAVPGWTIESAIMDGRDIMDVPFEVGSRQELSGLVVTFIDRPAEIEGEVPTLSPATPIERVTVIAFPADRQLWVPGARRVRIARPDTAGKYRILGVPPGEYFVAIVTDFDAEAELDASRLGALERAASRVTLRRPEPR